MLTVRQLTNHLKNLKVDILGNRNLTGKHLSQKGFHLNQSVSNFLTKNIFSKLRKFCKSLEHLSKPNRSTKSSEARNCKNEKKKVFSEDFKMKPQSPEKVSINCHKVICTQNAIYQYNIVLQI